MWIVKNENSGVGVQIDLFGLMNLEEHFKKSVSAQVAEAQRGTSGKWRTQSYRYPQDSVYCVWPPFSKLCMELFELVGLDLLSRSMFSSGIRLSIEWELSLPRRGQTGVFIFIVFSFCYIVYKGKVKAIFWFSVFNILWSLATHHPPRVFTLENYGSFFFCCLNKNSRQT